jgi:GntR family transcriptional regulator, transcriptional repressor for pyruvate dehydrogenase complex
MAESLQSEFEVIRRQKVYEAVAEQIERLILRKLKPGDKLPSERELTETLRVSRSSIRDAIRSLELLGLVEPRQGAGTIVREPTADLLISPFADVLKHKQDLVLELLEFRKILEPALAARAAQHASREELRAMDDILRRQEAKLADGDDAIAEDAEFHYAIAKASGNSIVLKVLDLLMDLLRDTRQRALQVPGRPQKSMSGHRKIFAAIKRHDPEAANAAMSRHIEDIEAIVSKNF